MVKTLKVRKAQSRFSSVATAKRHTNAAKQASRVKKTLRETVDRLAGSADAAEHEALLDAAFPRLACTRKRKRQAECEEIIRSQVELCNALKSHKPNDGLPKKQIKSEKANARMVRRAMFATHAKCVPRESLRPQNKRGRAGLGWEFGNKMHANVQKEIAASGLTSVVLGKTGAPMGARGWEDLEEGIEGRIRQLWNARCEPMAGKKGDKGMLAIKGLVTEVVADILEIINKDRGVTARQVTRYLVQKCRPPKARIARQRTDLCGLCIGGAKMLLTLVRKVEDLAIKYVEPDFTAEQFALADIDELDQRSVRCLLHDADEVKFHREDVATTLAHVDAQIQEAIRPGSTTMVVIEDFGCNLKLGKEQEDIGTSPAKGWANICAFRVFFRGRYEKYTDPDGIERLRPNPVRVHVISDELDHTAFAAHHALDAVLRAISPKAVYDAERFIVYTDNGGHFTSHVFVGGVLAELPRRYKFTYAECNHFPCYHGKTAVDGDVRHASELLTSASKRDKKRVINTGRKAVDALNREWARSKRTQGAFGKKGAKGRDYLAVYCDFGAEIPGGKYVKMDVPHLRSTYSLRSVQSHPEVAGSLARKYYNSGTPHSADLGELLGGDEITSLEPRPAPVAKKVRPIHKRMLNTRDHELKRKRRDAWSGVPPRGDWEECNANLIKCARKPPAGLDKGGKSEWVKSQLEIAIAHPEKSRVLVESYGGLHHGRIQGEGNLAGDERSIDIQVMTMVDTYPRDFAISELVRLFHRKEFYFLPEKMPSATNGSKPVLIVPWGADDEDPPRNTATERRCFMALCVQCGHWRIVPAATRNKFKGRKTDFRCKDSPWLSNCRSPLTDLESEFKRVGHSIKDRRGGE